MPEKFSNKTNGVTPRRWIALSNPRLASLLERRLGEGWLTDLTRLRELETLVDDAHFRAEWRDIKRFNKARYAAYVRRVTGVALDPDTLFDVQVKRIHEYKRQHLNLLHIVARYHRIRSNPDVDLAPRTFIFGGKAAPSYYMAKLMIRLVTAVAEVVNRDPVVNGRMRVVFVPDFNVRTGQALYAAAELSEQISTAGKEASGTGNMKFMMNGALTIGTLDGANIEIREEAGAENFFLFGLTAEEVAQRKREGYDPMHYYHANPDLRAAIDLIRDGFFSRGDGALFRPLIENLLNHDPYMLCADFQSYVDCQTAVDEAYLDPEHWTRMSILNTARSGKFSSDRCIREYSEEIWRVKPVPIGRDVRPLLVSTCVG